MRVLWCCYGRGANLVPPTAEQHCFVHPVVAYTLYEGLVEARWVRLGVPVGFQHPYQAALYFAVFC